MDAILKAWILLASGAFLWLVPPAFKLGKVPTLLCFQASIVCLSISTVTARKLIKIESLANKQEFIQAELIDSELSWQLDQGEEQLKQQYLINSAVSEVINEEPETDCRAQLERNLQETDRLVNELISRQKRDEPKEILLSNGSKKLLEYGKKRDWLDLRTLQKNWAKNHDFNLKELQSFCEELVKAELAEWGENKIWRVIRKTA